MYSSVSEPFSRPRLIRAYSHLLTAIVPCFMAIATYTT